MKDATARWVTLYREDRHMAESALRDGIFRQCIFHSQQMVEKILKAIWTERHGAGTHPRTHNLVKLAKALGLVVSRERETLLQELTDQVFPSRYPEAGWEYNREVAEEFYNRTGDLSQWLRQQLT